MNVKLTFPMQHFFLRADLCFVIVKHPVPLPTYREEAADRLWIRTIQLGASPPSHTSSAAHVSTVEMLRM